MFSSMFIAAGGFIHLRQWLDLYRNVPASSPGAAVVRIGFPINAATSLLLVVALVVAVRRSTRLAQAVVLAAIAFQAASLATLIATRVGTVLGWTEPSWTPGAEQTRAVEMAAIAALVVLAAVVRRAPSGAHSDPHEADPEQARDRDRTPAPTPVPVSG